MISAWIYFASSQSSDADVLLFVALCYVPDKQRRFLYWACLFLFLIAITNLTKPDELEKNKDKNKRCDPVSKLWKSIIISFDIFIFENVKILNVLEKAPNN